MLSFVGCRSRSGSIPPSSPKRYTQMKKMARKLEKISGRSMFSLALSLIVVLGISAGVRADEADAKRLLKAMSDYLAAQKALSF